MGLTIKIDMYEARYLYMRYKAKEGGGRRREGRRKEQLAHLLRVGPFIS